MLPGSETPPPPSPPKRRLQRRRIRFKPRWLSGQVKWLIVDPAGSQRAWLTDFHRNRLSINGTPTPPRPGWPAGVWVGTAGTGREKRDSLPARIRQRQNQVRKSSQVIGITHILYYATRLALDIRHLRGIAHLARLDYGLSHAGPGLHASPLGIGTGPLFAWALRFGCVLTGAGLARPRLIRFCSSRHCQAFAHDALAAADV